MNLLNNAGKLNENWPQKGEKSKKSGICGYMGSFDTPNRLTEIIPCLRAKLDPQLWSRGQNWFFPDNSSINVFF